MHKLQSITIVCQQVIYILNFCYWSCVTWYQIFWLQLPHLVNGINPLHDVSIRSTSYCIQVWERLVDIVTTEECPHTLDVHSHLVISFSRDMNEFYI